MFPHRLGSPHHLVVIKAILDMRVIIYFVSNGETGLDRINSLLNVSVEPLLIQGGHITKTTSHIMSQSTVLYMGGSVLISF